MPDRFITYLWAHFNFMGVIELVCASVLSTASKFRAFGFTSLHNLTFTGLISVFSCPKPDVQQLGKLDSRPVLGCKTRRLTQEQEALKNILSARWTWAVDGVESGDERILAIVEGVVNGLPSLRRLQLGDFEDPVRDPTDESDEERNDGWGVVVKSSWFVRDRERKKASEDEKRVNVGEKVEAKSTPDRRFSLRPVHVTTRMDDY